jgi:hypothetical protein
MRLRALKRRLARDETLAPLRRSAWASGEPLR